MKTIIYRFLLCVHKGTVFVTFSYSVHHTTNLKNILVISAHALCPIFFNKIKVYPDLHLGLKENLIQYLIIIK